MKSRGEGLNAIAKTKTCRKIETKHYILKTSHSKQIQNVQ